MKTPADVALLLSSALETTRADVNAAAQAQEAGENRRIGLGRTVVRLNEQHHDQLVVAFERLLATAHDHPDDDGVPATVLWTVIDRQDRRAQLPPGAPCDGPGR